MSAAPPPCLLTIPGIKWLNASTLIARTAKIKHISSTAALAHYAGLAPIRHGTAGNYHYRDQIPI